jgi:hypothetical protein
MDSRVQVWGQDGRTLRLGAAELLVHGDRHEPGRHCLRLRDGNLPGSGAAHPGLDGQNRGRHRAVGPGERIRRADRGLELSLRRGNHRDKSDCRFRKQLLNMIGNLV